MRTIETSTHVGKDHMVNIKLKLPDEVMPGDYNVLVVMDERVPKLETPRKKALEFSTWDWDASPGSCSFRREDIYGEEGR